MSGECDECGEHAVDCECDPINRPLHYQGNGMQAIDVIEAFGLNFRLGNVIKYVLRADNKSCRTDDLRKAAWYLQREIEKTCEKQ